MRVGVTAVAVAVVMGCAVTATPSGPVEPVAVRGGGGLASEPDPAVASGEPQAPPRQPQPTQPAKPTPQPQPTQPAKPTPKPTQPSGPSGPAAVMLKVHNDYRERHCAVPLTWSPQVARVAQAWADRLGRSCSLEHSSGPYGENLWAGSAGGFSTRSVVDAWYQESAKYDYRRPGFSMRTGHFTQVVWAGSRRLGCGAATCGRMQIWVCNYDPAGNVEGQFRQHVRPSTCTK